MGAIRALVLECYEAPMLVEGGRGSRLAELIVIYPNIDIGKLNFQQMVGAWIIKRTITNYSSYDFFTSFFGSFLM
jgi:hypothetical protein